MGSAFPIKIAAKTILAGAALLLLGACASVPVTPEGNDQIGSAQILSICEKLAKSNDTRIAIGLCEKAHTEDPENPVPLLILGDMLQQQGALAQAGRAYGMAIDLDPENVEAHYGLGKVFLARNQYDLATEQFEIARELNARDHRLYNALGVVLDNLGDHVAAQKHYQVGLELAPNNRALKKNLMLSRRLDDSVTSPAIGPRFEVVPTPASPPGDTQNGGGGPALGPLTTPENPEGPGIPAGRLGHEPLASVPGATPMEASKLPETKTVAAQASGSGRFAVTARHDAMDTAQNRANIVMPDGVPDAVEGKRNEAIVIQVKSGTGKHPDAAAANSEMPDAIPSEEVVKTAAAFQAVTSDLAYFPIVAPIHDPSVVQASLPQTIAEPQPAMSPLTAAPAVQADERFYVQPVLSSIRTTAAPLQAVDQAALSGPIILASGFDDLVVRSEPLMNAPAAQPVQIAALHRDSAELMKAEDGERNSPASAILPLVPTSEAEGFTSETSVSSLRPGAEAPEPHGRGLELSLETSAVADENLITKKSMPLPSADLQLPRVPKSRFGHEHEGDHETRQFKGEFWDLVDVINPMQHIPVVASIYRDVTEDEIKPAAKIAGGTLFGGVLGFASSIFDSVVEEVSGQDMTQTVVAALTQETPDSYQSADVLEQEQSAARILNRQSHR